MGAEAIAKRELCVIALNREEAEAHEEGRLNSE